MRTAISVLASLTQSFNPPLRPSRSVGSRSASLEFRRESRKRESVRRRRNDMYPPWGGRNGRSRAVAPDTGAIPTCRMSGIGRRRAPSRVNPQVWISASLATHSSYRNPNSPSRKILNEYSILGSPPNHPKSTGPENIGPERMDFGCFGIGAVGSHAATTFETNEKFQPSGSAENGLRREVGGAKGIRTAGVLWPCQAHASRSNWRWHRAPATISTC